MRMRAHISELGGEIRFGQRVARLTNTTARFEAAIVTQTLDANPRR